MSNTFPILVEDLAAIVADPKRGTISLIGEYGGLALITGEIYDSSIEPGSIAIETEHGTVRLERRTSIQISESLADPNETDLLADWFTAGKSEPPYGIEQDTSTQSNKNITDPLDPEELYVINHSLTALLYDQFHWVADSDDKAANDALDELTHNVGALISRLLTNTKDQSS